MLINTGDFKSLVSTNFTIRALDLFEYIATGRDRECHDLPRRRGRNGAGGGGGAVGFHGVGFYSPGADFGMGRGFPARPGRLWIQPQALHRVAQQAGHFIVASMWA